MFINQNLIVSQNLFSVSQSLFLVSQNFVLIFDFLHFLQVKTHLIVAGIGNRIDRKNEYLSEYLTLEWNTSTIYEGKGVRKLLKYFFFSSLSMWVVIIFWGLMLRKIDAVFVEEMGVHVKQLKVSSMIHCPEEVCTYKSILLYLCGCLKH